MAHKLRKWGILATVSAAALVSSTSANAMGVWDWAVMAKSERTASDAPKKAEKPTAKAERAR